MIVDVSTKKHPGVFMEIDDADWPLIRRYRWSATKRKNGFYVRGIVNGRDMLLHRFLMGAPRGMDVDHADGNTLNYRRSNLRICTQAENTKFAAERGAYVRPDATHVHSVRRQLADGTVKLYHYHRKTREPLGNEIVKERCKTAQHDRSAPLLSD